MKKLSILIVSAILASLLTACGGNSIDLNDYVSKEDYQALQKEHSDLENQIDALKDELSETTKKIEELDAELESIAMTSSTSLFEKVYAPLARRNVSHTYDDVVAYVDARGFEYTATEPVLFGDTIGEIRVEDGACGDYVYIAFLNRSNWKDEISVLSFYHENSNSEVTFTNLSDDGNLFYDELTTHIIGESDSNVLTVREQRDFLFKN